MEDFIAGFFGAVIIVLAIVGIVAVMTDLRRFDTLVEHCEKRGFVQDTTTRIKCSLESKNENSN